MKKIIGKNGVLLGLFALICTGLIALTQWLTAPKIAQQQQQQLQSTLQAVLPANGYNNQPSQHCIVLEDPQLGGAQQAYLAFNDAQPAGMAITVTAPNGYSGNIQLLVGVDDKVKVTGVRTLQHNETPGLGDKIELRVSDWILSFNGKHYDAEMDNLWAVKKDGGQFDQFTGATITPRAVVQAVASALQYIEQNQASLYLQANQCGEL